MAKISKLPASVINQIAAGEVVERPSSVIKELLENAVDSGATRIDVSVERGGKDLIRIADNGCGMSPEDLELAFLPHATSKIHSAEELENIQTLGFRGEALAAIAEISRVRCTTRTHDSDHASCLEIEGGLKNDIRKASGSQGTVFEVRDLFFNTPVRRRFLKSDTTESGHVVEAFQRVALAQPHIHMSYRSGAKLVYDIPAQLGLKERIGLFYGKELIEDLIWIDCQAENYRVYGFVAGPSHSRGSSRSQNFFVGGRYVRDRTLSHALMEAYRGLLMVGRQPVAFLKLDIPPEELDVNVHPAKVEVRFRESQKLYALLLSAIREKFLASDLHEKLAAHGQSLLQKPKVNVSPTAVNDFNPSATSPPAQHGPYQSTYGASKSNSFSLEQSQPQRQRIAEWFPSPEKNLDTVTPVSAGLNQQSYRGPNPADLSFQRPDPSTTLPGGSWSMATTSSEPFQADIQSETDSGNSSASSTIEPETSQNDNLSSDNRRVSSQAETVTGSAHQRAIQIHDSYLVVETDDGVSLVDQHALHERILYEELRIKLREGGVESQRLLIPEILELESVDHALALEHADVLNQLGLEIQDYGEPTIAILSIPLLARHLNAGELVRDLIERFGHAQAKPDPESILNLTLATIACKAAVKAGDKLKPEEIEALLIKGTQFSESHHCPHGRPSALVLTKSELEKQFGRT